MDSVGRELPTHIPERELKQKTDRAWKSLEIEGTLNAPIIHAIYLQ